jgi:hypothetical protein
VTGPARYFPDRPLVRTAPLDLARLEGAGELTLPLLPPDSHLLMEVPEVKVAYSVGLLAERTLADVPVRALADDGLEVGVSPARVDVLVRGVARFAAGAVPGACPGHGGGDGAGTRPAPAAR